MIINIVLFQVLTASMWTVFLWSWKKNIFEACFFTAQPQWVEICSAGLSSWKATSGCRFLSQSMKLKQIDQSAVWRHRSVDQWLQSGVLLLGWNWNLQPLFVGSGLVCVLFIFLCYYSSYQQRETDLFIALIWWWTQPGSLWLPQVDRLCNYALVTSWCYTEFSLLFSHRLMCIMVWLQKRAEWREGEIRSDSSVGGQISQNTLVKVKWLTICFLIKGN